MRNLRYCPMAGLLSDNFKRQKMALSQPIQPMLHYVQPVMTPRRDLNQSSRPMPLQRPGFPQNFVIRDARNGQPYFHQQPQSQAYVPYVQNQEPRRHFVESSIQPQPQPQPGQHYYPVHSQVVMPLPLRAYPVARTGSPHECRHLPSEPIEDMNNLYDVLSGGSGVYPHEIA